MEAAIKDLGTRVQQLETENQLEENLVYRLNRDLLAAQSELNATLYRQRELTGKVDQILRKQSTRRYRGWGGEEGPCHYASSEFRRHYVLFVGNLP